MPNSPLRKYLKKFGPIRTEENAKRLIDLAKQELYRRKHELQLALDLRLKIRALPNGTLNFVIPLKKGRVIAEANITVGPGKQYLYINTFTVGENVVVDGKLRAKTQDSFRNLGISRVLIDNILMYAIKNRFKKVRLTSNKNKIRFYSKFGFTVEEDYSTNYCTMAYNINA